MKDIILGIVRHLLTAGGGYVVAKGFVDADQANQLVGAVLVVVGVIASVVEKKLRK
jgi:hypothetical protein